MASPMSIHTTLGAILLGGLFAAFHSGAVMVQVIIYMNLYPKDVLRNKVLVAWIWLIDISHTTLVWHALWGYIIGNYCDRASLDYIGWDIATSVVLTAMITFSVHCFLAHRIWMLSSKNCYLTLPILFLAVCRLIAACASTAEMIITHSFFEFRAKFKWLFTLGLSSSTGGDILITISLLYLLNINRQSARTMSTVINSLVRYTLETGALTSTGTLVAMICWLASGNLIFLGIHFVICKLYATSLLTTLNIRQQLRHATTNSNNIHTDMLRVAFQRPKYSSGVSEATDQFDGEYPLSST